MGKWNTSPWFAMSAAAAVALGASDGAIAFLLRALLEPGAPTWHVVVALVAVVVARGVAHALMISANSVGREAFGAGLRAATVQWLLSESAEASRLVGATVDLAETHPRALTHAQMRAGLTAQLLQLLVLAVAATVLSPRLAPPTIAGLGLVGLLIARAGREVRARAVMARSAHEAFLSDVHRIVVVTPLLRALRLEPLERMRARERIAAYGALARRAAASTAMAAVLPTMAGAPVLAIAFAAMLLAGEPGAVVVPLVVLLVRMTMISSAVATTWATVRSTGDAYARAVARLTVRSSDPGIAPPPRPQTPPPDIQLREVAIDVERRKLLAPTSLAVPPGAWLVITGPTGAGKSTLIDVVLGLRSPSRGDVLLAGQPPELYVREHRIGYLGPRPALFAGTLRENLRVCHPDVGDEDLRVALERARASDVASRLGLDGLLGEDGAPLSSGERQRIGLARALVGTPALLVLDEPTAHVDPETEKQIFASIHALSGTTTIVVATHRIEHVPPDARVLRLSSAA